MKISINAECDCCSMSKDNSIIEFKMVADKIQIYTMTCNKESIVYVSREELIKVLEFLK